MDKEGIWKIALPVPLPTLFDYLPPNDGSRAAAGARVQVQFGRRTLIGILVGFAKSSELPLSRLARVTGLPDEGAALLDPLTLDLLTWCAAYYKHPIGEVMIGAIPPVLRKVRSTLPAPQSEFRITTAGTEHLQNGSRSAPVQKAVLEILVEGPSLAEPLAAAGKTWRNSLKRLLELGLAEEGVASPALARPNDGPELTDEQREAVSGVRSKPSGFNCHLLDGVTGSGKTEVYMSLLEEVLARGEQG